MSHWYEFSNGCIHNEADGPSIQQQRGDWLTDRLAEMKSLTGQLSDRIIDEHVCVPLNLCAIVILLTQGRLPHIRLCQPLYPLLLNPHSLGGVLVARGGVLLG